MAEKEIRLKYKSMPELLDDMDYLVQLGFANLDYDQNTGRLNYQMNESGILALKKYLRDGNNSHEDC